MKRSVAVMIGSESDLDQCLEGLLYLKKMIDEGNIENLKIIINSIHRNTKKTLSNLARISRDKVQFLILGAGWANQLTGTGEAYLRYDLHSTSIQVLGVAFEDLKNNKHTQAAVLSITELPGAQIIYCGVGQNGFFEACVQASIGRDFPAIKEPKARPIQSLPINSAIKLAREQRSKRLS